MNRVIRPADFRAAVRHGRRIGTPSSVIHIVRRDVMEPARLGFVVSKAVGNAVTRNRVKRRLRAIGSDALRILPVGTDVVVRALPASSEVSWTTLHTEITEGITMGLART